MLFGGLIRIIRVTRLRGISRRTLLGTLFLFVLALSMISVTSLVQAQNSTIAGTTQYQMPTVTIFPDNPLYAMKVGVWEPIQLALMSSVDAKVYQLLDQASARVVELQHMQMEGKNQYTVTLTSDYQSKMSATDNLAHSITNSTTQLSVYERIAAATAAQLEILQAVEGNATAGTQSSIIAAVTVGSNEHEIATQMLMASVQFLVPQTPPPINETTSSSSSSSETISTATATTSSYSTSTQITTTTTLNFTSTDTWSLGSSASQPSGPGFAVFQWFLHFLYGVVH